MKIFRKLLVSNYFYFDIVSPPNMYCPLPWWNCKESYYSDHYKIKYDVKNMTNKEMLSSSIGIHLWNNFTHNKHNIDFTLANQDSLYNSLYNIIFN